MARTQAGAALTERHRQRQLQIRAAATNDYRRVWDAWDGTPQRFAAVIRAAVPLVESYNRASAGLAIDYYQAFRMAEDVTGSATLRLVDPPSREQVTTSLHVTGRVQVARSLRAGMPPQAAMSTAFVTTSGAVTRHVLAGGRGTLIRSTAADRQASAWERVTDANPCPFCLMLASRGPVYRGEDTAAFRAHDHCACSVAPNYGGPASERNQRFQEVWDESQEWAKQSGEMPTDTDNDALNALRRFLTRA